MRQLYHHQKKYHYINEPLPQLKTPNISDLNHPVNQPEDRLDIADILQFTDEKAAIQSFSQEREGMKENTNAVENLLSGNERKDVNLDNIVGKESKDKKEKISQEKSMTTITTIESSPPKDIVDQNGFSGTHDF